ncbi:MAG: hypothetical protein MnENMB40S_22750 [Rhizobiaceae bacterium MnEN-MB40S]|nr:MAG: hypothetical protein MnENMB40S_22750 [Rhizobiaceae bacterium MnEN-MB40S]
MELSQKTKRLIEAGSEHYIPTGKYDLLIDMLVGNITDDQRRETIADAMKLELGERLNIWPASIKEPTDEELASATAEGNAHLAEIAADPNITVDPETGIPSTQPDETPEEIEAAMKKFRQHQNLSYVHDKLNGRIEENTDVDDLLEVIADDPSITADIAIGTA